MRSAPGCVITIEGTVGAGDEDYYIGYAGTASSIEFDMDWIPSGDLDLGFYDKYGGNYFWIGGGSSSLTYTMDTTAGDKGYFVVESYEGYSIDYTIVMTGQ